MRSGARDIPPGTACVSKKWQAGSILCSEEIKQVKQMTKLEGLLLPVSSHFHMNRETKRPNEIDQEGLGTPVGDSA